LATASPGGAAPENRHLTVTISGPGAVRSTPAGIDCGPLCGATYTAGTSVTLVAAPTTGARFMGWTGACPGTSAVCNVLLSGDASVGANFEMEAVTARCAWTTPTSSTWATRSWCAG
jgi:hypothetical protein